MNAHMLFARTCIQMNAIADPSDQSSFEGSSDSRFDMYKSKLLMQAEKQVKQALQLALNLNCLSALREGLFTLALVCSKLVEHKYEHKKNHAASLFLVVDQIVKENEGKCYAAEEVNLEFKSLISTHTAQAKEMLNLLSD